MSHHYSGLPRSDVEGRDETVKTEIMDRFLRVVGGGARKTTPLEFQPGVDYYKEKNQRAADIFNKWGLCVWVVGDRHVLIDEQGVEILSVHKLAFEGNRYASSEELAADFVHTFMVELVRGGAI
jgi:hypothetical protein